MPDGPARRLRQRLSSLLGAIPGIEAAYLFGSHARGEGGPMSDVDVAVLAADPVPSTARADLAARVADALEAEVPGRVDVTILNDAPPALVHRVLRDGLLLFARDERRRTVFEARAIDEFLDFLPILERYDRALFARARQGRLGT